jgi:hypothetical protein
MASRKITRRSPQDLCIARTKLFNHPHFSNPNNAPKQIGGVELSVNNPQFGVINATSVTSQVSVRRCVCSSENER